MTLVRANLAPRKWHRFLERILIGLICFIVLAMVAYQFGQFVLIWRR
jgi:hypothetical protein